MPPRRAGTISPRAGVPPSAHRTTSAAIHRRPIARPARSRPAPTSGRRQRIRRDNRTRRRPRLPAARRPVTIGDRRHRTRSGHRHPGADPIPTTTDSPGLRLSLSTMAPPGCARRESRVADRRFRFSHPPRLPGTPDRRSSPSSPAHDTAPTEAASNAPIDAGHKLRAAPGSPPTRTIPPGSPKINKKDLRNRWRDPADYSIRGGGEPTTPRARNP